MAFLSNFRMPPFHTDSHTCIRIGGPIAYNGGPVALELLELMVESFPELLELTEMKPQTRLDPKPCSVEL